MSKDPEFCPINIKSLSTIKVNAVTVLRKLKNQSICQRRVGAEAGDLPPRSDVNLCCVVKISIALHILQYKYTRIFCIKIRFRRNESA